MSEPSLTAVFGMGAYQDLSTLTIAKADLAAVGLSADSANTAESLLAAILLLAANSLTTSAQTTNPDQACCIQSANTTVWDSPYGTKLRQNLLVSFDNDFTDPGITPDVY